MPGTDTGERPVVLRLITRLNIGGPALHALTLSRGLRDFETVLGAGTPDEHEGELADPAVQVVRLPLTRSVRPMTDAMAYRAVRQLIARHRPAIVHTHMAKAGAIGRLAALTTRRRPLTIHTFHGHVLEGYFGRAVQRAFLEVERRLAKRTDLLLAVSDEIRDELLELGIGSPDRFRVIPLGLPLTPFLAVEGPTGAVRRELGLASDASLVAVVGRLVPIKDHLTTFRAIARVPAAHLVVIGDGELRQELGKEAAALGVADRVHFLGWRHDMPEVLADVDLVVLTSRNEGTPVALIEALAARRAVVATDVGGVRSVVADGVTGLLRPAADHEGIAEAITTLLADPARRRAMGDAGRRAVSTRFGEQRLVDDMHRLYTELLDTRRR